MLLKDGMGLKMENFNIMWVHWKIQFLGGRAGVGSGSHTKNNIQGEFVRKGGLRQFADLRERDLTKKRAMHFI